LRFVGHIVFSDEEKKETPPSSQLKQRKSQETRQIQNSILQCAWKKESGDAKKLRLGMGY
jgi:hypothetical protein